MITYEFPLIERVRTLLRLEDLFDRASRFVDSAEPHHHHVALTTLFEILEVLSRAELKSELLQELERQRQIMLGLHGNSQVDGAMLVRVIEDIEAASSSLFAMTGKIGQHLRENEWLMQIKQRTSIPGGTCEFDLPHYHHWQHRPAGHRVQDLRTWITPLLPIRSSVRLVLGLLRQSGSPLRIVANKGLFQQNLGGRVVQMVRIQVVDEAPEVPEVSANRLALNIRFTVLTEDARPRVAETNVDFELTFCSL